MEPVTLYIFECKRNCFVGAIVDLTLNTLADIWQLSLSVVVRQNQYFQWVPRFKYFKCPNSQKCTINVSQSVLVR
jgi:hypothetical protein